MNALEIGQKMISAISRGRDSEWQFVSDYYAQNIVSIEGQGTDQMPARMEGMAAIKGKHEWWYGNHEVHRVAAEGPFVGNRDDQFVIRFQMDMTPNGGERTSMTEVGIYTTKGDKIVQEEYLYLME